MKLCKDCKFFRMDWGSPISGRFAKCTRHSVIIPNLVTGRGEIDKKWQYCSIERDFERLCGPEARYFETK